MMLLAGIGFKVIQFDVTCAGVELYHVQHMACI